MAITNAQQYKQLMQNGGRIGLRGGGADMGAEDKAQERADRGYGDPGGGLAAGENTPSQDRIAEIRQANITLENLRQDKIEEKLEKFRNLGGKQRQFQNFLSKFSPISMFASKFGPLNNKDFFTDKVLSSKNFSNMTKEQFANLTNEEQEDMFGDYMSDRMSGATDAYGNPIGDRGGDGINQILPVDTTFVQAPSNMDQEPVVEEEEPFEMSRRFRAEGGIMNTDVVGGEMDFESARQMYGLGKLVKKVTRSVKKIAKSPIGKAALLYAGGSYLSGMGAFGNLKGAGFLKSPAIGFKNFMMGKPLATKTYGDSVMRSKGFLDMIGGKVGAGILGTSALSYFMTPEEEEEQKLLAKGADIDDVDTIINNPYKYTNPRLMAEGGSTEEKEPVAKKVMPLLDMDGKEKDYRETGGFVDMGRMEKADDVPARLSKNEFVFTADAVRNAGDGSVDKGAEVMYNMMKNLESGGDVSEESQGLDGARKMFQTSQRLEEVL